MANSYVEYDSGLTATTYNVPFKYISINDVKARGYDGSDWSDELTIASRDSSANTITLDTAPSSYTKIRVYRSTSTEQLVDFQNGSRLSESDLDTAYQQGLFVAQEVSENASTLVEGIGPQGPQGIQGETGETGADGSVLGVAYIVDQKAQGTDGGGLTGGVWNDRDLNTEVYDYGDIASVSSNQFTISGAGTYIIDWSCPAVSVDNFKSALYDVTADTTLIHGSVGYAHSSYGGESKSHGSALVTLTTANTYKLRSFVNTTQSTFGAGVATGNGVETYSTVKITKLA